MNTNPTNTKQIMIGLTPIEVELVDGSKAPTSIRHVPLRSLQDYTQDCAKGVYDELAHYVPEEDRELLDQLSADGMTALLEAGREINLPKAFAAVKARVALAAKMQPLMQSAADGGGHQIAELVAKAVKEATSGSST